MDGFGRWLRFGVLGVVVVAAGCRGKVPEGGAAKQYPVRGVVVSTDEAAGEVVLNHAAIPGFMGAMTMSYKLRDRHVISEIHAGDRITATMLADEDAAGPANLRLDQIVVVAQARPDTVPKVQYHVPAVGEVVPDFPLLNEDGKRIRLSQFRGKVVVVTFVYTRCPLADFCPKMSRNFAEIDKALAEDKVLYAKTHLVSLSFDPAYDTPAVLKSYGGAYTGKYSKETFGHWDFAAPSVADLATVEQWFDLGVQPGDAGTLNHSLATVVVGKDGRVVAFYPTNEWTVEALLAQVRAAVAA